MTKTFRWVSTESWRPQTSVDDKKFNGKLFVLWKTNHLNTRECHKHKIAIRSEASSDCGSAYQNAFVCFFVVRVRLCLFQLMFLNKFRLNFEGRSQSGNVNLKCFDINQETFCLREVNQMSFGKHAFKAWNRLLIRKIKVPTNCSVAYECFLILKHGIDSDLLAVLSSDDGNRWLFVWGNRRHLLYNFNLLVFVMNSCERVEIHRLDKTTSLKRDDDFKNFFFRPSIVSVDKSKCLHFWGIFTFEVSLVYLARSSGEIGFGYACSINSRTFSGVNGTISNSSFSIETEIGMIK